MFGYIVPNQSVLNNEQRSRFHSIYCGLCRTIRIRHGLTSTLTLSYDLTFLALLLSSLYEFPETHGEERCLPHPINKHTYVTAAPFDYAADMNVALAYHKFIDNWHDDCSIISVSEAILLKQSYKRISAHYPEKCRAIEKWLRDIHLIEDSECTEVDLPVNSTGRMLGELFSWKYDFWHDSLFTIGDALGRFIYFMDAYDDLEKDLRSKNYNPLKMHAGKDYFEEMCKRSMTMMVADCTVEFEKLPILRDVDLLRNVLYSGIWSRYAQVQKKRNSKGAE